jgi:hypothetical protein
MNTRPRIFISYSHRDKAYTEQLMVHMVPLRKRFDFDLWDQDITLGEFSKAEVESTLKGADIAILLVSPDYLASEWISNVELPTLLERAERGEARVIPIILRPSAWAHTPLAYFQALPRDGKPLSALPTDETDRVWFELYKVLEAELHRLSKGQEATPRPVVQQRGQGKSATSGRKGGGKDRMPKEETTVALDESMLPKFFISHAKEDGDFAENLQGRLKEIGFHGWIDINVLEAGEDWRKEIDQAILNSKALILVLSPDSKSSEYVTYEWAFALGSGLRIVPLMLRDTPIHPRLEIFQYLDFTNRRARPWDRLFELLKDVAEFAHKTPNPEKA